jgi:GntR family L-lactate dehydrogenase operon transcriptional regulator
MPRPSLIGGPSGPSQTQIEAKALEFLAVQGTPVGAGVLQRALVEQGVELGPATAGRLLRQLDEQGVTEKHGRMGRTLTNHGYRRLEALRRRQDRHEHGQRFVRTIDAESPLILLDVLIGRRAIERESARLAATRATDEELRTLQSLFDQHERQRARGGDAVLENRDFHLFITRIAKSRVLETALDLILTESSVSEVLIRTRREAGSHGGDDHPRIVAAILRRDAAAAEAAMMRHIDNIVFDLYRFHGGELPPIDQVLTEPHAPTPPSAAQRDLAQGDTRGT